MKKFCREPHFTSERAINRRVLAARILRFLGNVWVSVAFLVIAIGYAMIWDEHGFFALNEILSPYNLWNDVAVFATIAPGVVLREIASRIDGGKRSESNE